MPMPHDASSRRAGAGAAGASRISPSTSAHEVEIGGEDQVVVVGEIVVELLGREIHGSIVTLFAHAPASARCGHPRPPAGGDGDRRPPPGVRRRLAGADPAPPHAGATGERARRPIRRGARPPGRRRGRHRAVHGHARSTRHLPARESRALPAGGGGRRPAGGAAGPGLPPAPGASADLAVHAPRDARRRGRARSHPWLRWSRSPTTGPSWRSSGWTCSRSSATAMAGAGGARSPTPPSVAGGSVARHEHLEDRTRHRRVGGHRRVVRSPARGRRHRPGRRGPRPQAPGGPGRRSSRTATR